MTQFLSDSFERRTGTPLKVVGGDTRLASLLALLSPSRPVIFVDDKPDRPVTRKDIDEKGAIVVWPATDTAGAPPPAIKATFPDLVAEVPRAFERPVQGALPLFRIGWGMIRAKRKTRRRRGASRNAHRLSDSFRLRAPCRGTASR